jgi:hypothetical protein
MLVAEHSPDSYFSHKFPHSIDVMRMTAYIFFIFGVQGHSLKLDENVAVY